MTFVINVAAITPRIKALGWDSLNTIEAVDELSKAQIPGPAVLAYLDALIASQAGVDDQTITGCEAATADKITAWLKNKGLVTS